MPPKPSDEAVAKACHEALRAYAEALGETGRPSWEDAPQSQRRSARLGVAFLRATPGATMADLHDRWLAEKKAAGWRFGPVKDELAKHHPCMRPWSRLPLSERLKDFLFRAMVRILTMAAEQRAPQT